MSCRVPQPATQPFLWLGPPWSRASVSGGPTEQHALRQRLPTDLLLPAAELAPSKHFHHLGTATIGSSGRWYFSLLPSLRVDSQTAQAYAAAATSEFGSQVMAQLLLRVKGLLWGPTAPSRDWAQLPGQLCSHQPTRACHSFLLGPKASRTWSQHPTSAPGSSWERGLISGPHVRTVYLGGLSKGPLFISWQYICVCQRLITPGQRVRRRKARARVEAGREGHLEGCCFKN